MTIGLKQIQYTRAMQRFFINSVRTGLMLPDLPENANELAGRA